MSSFNSGPKAPFQPPILSSGVPKLTPPSGPWSGISPTLQWDARPGLQVPGRAQEPSGRPRPKWGPGLLGCGAAPGRPLLPRPPGRPERGLETKLPRVQIRFPPCSGSVTSGARLLRPRKVEQCSALGEGRMGTPNWGEHSGQHVQGTCLVSGLSAGYSPCPASDPVRSLQACLPTEAEWGHTASPLRARVNLIICLVRSPSPSQTRNTDADT